MSIFSEEEKTILTNLLSSAKNDIPVILGPKRITTILSLIGRLHKESKSEGALLITHDS